MSDALIGHGELQGLSGNGDVDLAFEDHYSLNGVNPAHLPEGVEEAKSPASSFGTKLDHVEAAKNVPSVVCDVSEKIQESEDKLMLNERAIRKDGFAIMVPPPSTDRWEYLSYQEPVVQNVLGDYNDNGEISYIVRLRDGQEEQLSFEDLIDTEGGPAAIERYEGKSDSDITHSVSSEAEVVRRSARSARPRSSRFGTLSFLTLSLNGEAEDSEDSSTQVSASTRRQRRLTARSHTRRSRSQATSDSMRSESSDGEGLRLRRPRGAAQKRINYSDLRAIQSSDESDEPVRLGKRKRGPSLKIRGPAKPAPYHPEGTRKSGRNVRSSNMQEIGEEDIPEQVVSTAATKFAGANEMFKQLPGNDDFRLRHCQTCETCNAYGNSEDRGKLVYCQSCSLSYHQKCLGSRNTRDHLVTKIGERDFVLQCRRCINFARQKEATAPDQAKCFSCAQPSRASQPLRERKSNKQEQKEREDNNGEDPITKVETDRINNIENVLFRCLGCYRACHFHHLPSKNGKEPSASLSIDYLADERFSQYSKKWTCNDCTNVPANVESLVAWRPATVETYEPGTVFESLNEDDKQYLIKWKKLSYFDVTWMPGPWVWGTVAPAMRKAFAKRENSTFPKMTTEDAVPEDHFRVDIVFDIEYTNVVSLHTLQVDQARAKEVDRALVKFRGLGYEDVVWCKPPLQEDNERWTDFKTAYDDFVMGSYTRPPAASTLSGQLNKLRRMDFGTKVKLEKQPANLTGGELMGYQLEGINWIYYQWFRKQNAILADEMGLGKTIQIIGFLATLVQAHDCFPFLVVVPNSTCPNWRREIKQWAPSMRVVTYYGSSEARRLAEKHELFRRGNKELSCHVVVTSYDAAQDDEFRRVFRGVHWQGLVVDEGQRLKNDKNLLYGALSALKIPFKILLTGTPLQNNQRELFNLLQFLDTSLVAQDLEEEYAEITRANVHRLHEMLRPFFLRRTKLEVLDFLPPVAQIIVPVSLTNVQKKLYRSIFAKNPDLIRSVIGDTKKANQNERASLNNILMQLRKTLCHPFVYSRAIEQIDPNPAIAHRNFVEASSKLKLLEIMLPKLKERGHRVLIFSQFLDMLSMVEDFLDGLGLLYQRLDGSMGSLQKQKRIDEFNAPDSSLFAFLLSTRAGGVGINLASADTVIILDPDFNPHQDIQALSRAHRIGQKNKVLVFQMTTRGTVEEKIMQVGKKKMSLDHVLIEQMDAEDDTGADIESILRFGLDAIFTDDEAADDIRYDSASVDKLLDRSQLEETLPGKDKSAESQFSFARVWANDKGILEEEGLDDSSDQNAPVDPSTWNAILQEREREAQEEAAAKAEFLGRGRRRRDRVDYKGQDEGFASPTNKHPMRKMEGESDTDYMTPGEESDDEFENEQIDEVGKDEPLGEVSEMLPRPKDPNSVATPPARTSKPNSRAPPASETRQFQRADLSRAFVDSVGMAPAAPSDLSGWMLLENEQNTQIHDTSEVVMCIACTFPHRVGRCPLKRLGWEYCPLCSIAHFGRGNKSCAHLASETQCMLMLQAIGKSTESAKLKEIARKEVVKLLGRAHDKKLRKRAQKIKEQESQLAEAAKAPPNTSLDGQDHNQYHPTPPMSRSPYPRPDHQQSYQPEAGPRGGHRLAFNR